MTVDITEAEQAIRRAIEESDRICTPGEQWRMTIPADPSRDSDLIFAELITLAQALLKERAELGEATVEWGNKWPNGTVNWITSNPAPPLRKDAIEKGVTRVRRLAYRTPWIPADEGIEQ